MKNNLVISVVIILFSITVSDALADEKLPEWVKNIFVWYGQGQVTDSEVLDAIEYLAKNQIIQIEMANKSMQMMNHKMMTQGIMQEMPFNPEVPITIPMVDAYHNGERVYFIHTEISDAKMAQRMSLMINFPTLYVSQLSDIPQDELSKVYVFTNGIQGKGPYGGGPFMYQIDIFDSIPGESEYNQFRNPHLVTWTEDSEPRLLTSVNQLMEAKQNGEVTIQQTDVVVNAPVIVWNENDKRQTADTLPRIFESMSGIKGEVIMTDTEMYLTRMNLNSQDQMKMMN